MKCPRCQQENRAGQKFCGDCGNPVGGLVGKGSYAELQAEIERLRCPLDETSEQQTATADILHAMSAFADRSSSGSGHCCRDCRATL